MRRTCGMHYYCSRVVKTLNNCRMLLIVVLIASCSESHPQLDNNSNQNRYFGNENTPPVNTRLITVGSDTLTVEIARTPEQRAMGLMFRDSLAEDRGMIFVFEQPQIMNFWMKNTYIPLDIAYIDRNGEIMEIYQLQPRSETTIRSTSYCLYALEVNRDWFKMHDIEEGDRVIFISEP
jgi:uncharacterized protein